MKDLTERRQLLVDTCKKLDDEFIQVIREAEEKNDMKLIIKGHALKRKSDEKESQAGTLEESIKILKEKRRKIIWKVINMLHFVDIDRLAQSSFKVCFFVRFCFIYF